jgi:hypothetical protein
MLLLENENFLRIAPFIAAMTRIVLCIIILGVVGESQRFGST